MSLREEIEAFVPFNEQEAGDRRALLALMDTGMDLWTRKNEFAHWTASAWVTDGSGEQVLLCFHNLYRSWSWLGGHADGDHDLLAVAEREVCEESGLNKVRPLSEKIFSLEILTVDGHEKRGAYVPSHLHLNVTYLLQADPNAPLTKKEDENSAVAWFPAGEAVEASSEPWFRERIYPKLNEKMARFFKKSGAMRTGQHALHREPAKSGGDF